MKYKSLGPMETVIFEWLLGYNNEPEGPPDDMAIELAALLRGEHMNCEHAQQHKGDYLASCQGCVNEMRLECIQLLAEVASGNPKFQPLNTLGMAYLHMRVNAAAAYLANTSFTDEDEGMQQ